MADIQAPPLPPQAQPLSITLPHKPTASLSCAFVKGTTPTLIVHLNGLGLPQSHWWPSVTNYLTTFPSSHPSFLTYDRYGQGTTTSPDPQDESDQNKHLPPGHRHDITSVVSDLHALIQHVALNYHQYELSKTVIVLVANSIGCAVARYYAQQYPRTVSGLILLDSYMSDTTFIDIYPDPDGPSFNESELPEGVTVEDIRAAREGMGKLFHPTVVNKEGFWRGSVTDVLPHSYEPKLLAPGEGDERPYVTVVGHDWDIFAEESLRMKGMTRLVAMNYTNVAWGKYNEGLLKITSEERAKGVVIAKGAGHFVQQYRPDLVAEEVGRVVKLLEVS
ncbi:hypothetical protein TWF694_003485 [Orbilia ellipsospora]|uniref:AB hydrolase-1 domain-containing protein n=1 Tax=Orbilia ellipsospora TaxID=2528407 RepID=A0AAV9X0T2_9PEZI